MRTDPTCDHEWSLYDDRDTNIVWACEKCHVIQHWTPVDVQRARDEAAIDKWEQDKAWREAQS